MIIGFKQSDVIQGGKFCNLYQTQVVKKDRYVTDYKGYTLGMSAQEINLLQAYRAKGKWINSAKEFQRITKVSDSLLKTIAPYFKFPDWVTSSSQKLTSTANTSVKSFAQKLERGVAEDAQ